jgi:hypothetical protein
MTLNLESDIDEQIAALDETKWTPLQADVCMGVARAKLDRFMDQAERLAELVRVRVLPKAVAADYLHQTAIYNQLYFEYGADHIQEIMAQALGSEAAA